MAGTSVKVHNGIVVDEYCRTNVDGIYAAGEVANHVHPVVRRHVRVEHWQHALKEGPATARAMLGQATPYDDIHWFWSDQYDASLQYARLHTEWDELVVRGLQDRNSVAFYLKDGRMDAVVAMNRGRDVRRSMPLIKAARVAADAVRLRDEDVDLRTLASA